MQVAADLGNSQAVGQRCVDLGVAVAHRAGTPPPGSPRVVIGAVSGDGPLHGLGEVVKKVPPVGNLDGERSAAGGAL